ncbi:MAG: WYL domain-containing protein, partial [Clostridia bacterium]|nr:WYL domain-containing protein [Clostridia bacterium]
MYGGEVVPVTMVFLFKMMGAVMDKFGHDIMIMKEDEKHFRITVPVAVSQQFFGWVFGLGKMARIVAPENVRDGMVKALNEIRERYGE